jgi:hypothetical protein
LRWRRNAHPETLARACPFAAAAPIVAPIADGQRFIVAARDQVRRRVRRIAGLEPSDLRRHDPAAPVALDTIDAPDHRAVIAAYFNSDRGLRELRTLLSRSDAWGGYGEGKEKRSQHWRFRASGAASEAFGTA